MSTFDRIAGAAARSLRAVLICGAPMLAPALAQAQSQPVSALDVSLARSRSLSPTRFGGNHIGLAIDVTASRWRHESGSGGTVLAFGVTMHGAIQREWLLATDPGAVREPRHPDVASLAALIGWRSAGGYWRVLAGPAIAQADYPTGGISTRVELSWPPHEILQLTAHARLLTLPRYHGAAYHIANLGLGLRVQR